MREVKSNTKKIYKSILYIVLILILSFLSYCFYNKAMIANKIYKINYQENSNIDYKVCLKENEFYEHECLEKNMKYVASLIDKIHIDMNYIFKTKELINSNYTYKVVGKLIISDPADDNNILLSKEEIITEAIAKTTNNKKELIVDNSVDITYDKYNKIVNKFKTTFGIAANGRLEIHLLINNNSYLADKEELKYAGNSDLVVFIPLSENSINIKIDYALIDNSDSISYKDKWGIINYLYLIISIILLILIIFLITKFILYIKKNTRRKTKYEKKLNSILREYDRLIVESSTLVDKEKFNIINIVHFTELVDVRENLRLPIIFNEVIKDRMSYFYIKKNKDLYLYVLDEFNAND